LEKITFLMAAAMMAALTDNFSPHIMLRKSKSLAYPAKISAGSEIFGGTLEIFASSARHRCCHFEQLCTTF
jgi:hypothetical protein